jgi:outer membrane protein
MGLARVSVLGLAAVLSSAAAAAADPITLRSAVDTALRNHPILERETADHDTTVAHVGQTGAAYLPHVNLQASGRDDYVDPSDAFSSKDMIGFSNEFIYSGQLAVNQLLTDSGLTRANLDNAHAVERQARDGIAVSRLDVELGVAQAYLNVLRGKDLSAVSTGAIALVQEQLNRATALFKSTLRPEIDVLSAQTQMAQAQLQKLRDDNTIENQVVQLQNAIGSREPHQIEVLPLDIKPLDNEAELLDQLSAESLDRRPELAALREGVAAAEATVRVGETRTSPQISVQAGV